MEFAIALTAYFVVMISDFRIKLKNRQSKKEIWVYIVILALSFGIYMMYLFNPCMKSIAHYITIFVEKFINIKSIQ